MRFLVLLLSVLFGAVLRAQDDAADVCSISVLLRDGRVDLAELGRALLAAYDFDGDALSLPHTAVDLRGTRGALLLFATRKLLLDTVRFRRQLATETLVVRIDRRRAREVRRQLRGQLAAAFGRLAGEDLEARRYRLALPDTVDPSRRLAVLVHGVESDAGMWSDLQAFLTSQHMQIATFEYPNDEAIERIALRLAAELQALGEQPVVIVAHSMGGLVARAIIEDARLDPGNVEQLILIGTPNQGSKLAGLRIVLEAAHLLPEGIEQFGEAVLARWLESLRDGLGEAGGDLLPDSVFLRELAARGRNPRVDYHVVLGSRSVLSEAQRTQLAALVGSGLGRSTLTEVLRPKLEHWLADLDEVVDGRGDGAVSLARGRLDGIEPVIVPLDHLGLVRVRGVLGPSIPADQHPVFARIAAWLRETKR